MGKPLEYLTWVGLGPGLRILLRQSVQQDIFGNGNDLSVENDFKNFVFNMLADIKCMVISAMGDKWETTIGQRWP